MVLHTDSRAALQALQQPRHNHSGQPAESRSTGAASETQLDTQPRWRPGQRGRQLSRQASRGGASGDTARPSQPETGEGAGQTRQHQASPLDPPAARGEEEAATRLPGTPPPLPTRRWPPPNSSPGQRACFCRETKAGLLHQGGGKLYDGFQGQECGHCGRHDDRQPLLHHPLSCCPTTAALRAAQWWWRLAAHPPRDQQGCSTCPPPCRLLLSSTPLTIPYYRGCCAPSWPHLHPPT